MGSPQLDVSVLNGLLPPLPPGPLRVGHLATPNRHDWCKPELCCDYDEQDVLQGICGALAEIRGANLCVRLHPRHLRGKNPLPVLPANVSLDPVEQRSSVDDFVARHHIIIGSYSSSLLSARLRGRPTISYQPQRGKVIRGEILSAAGISVARCSKQLVEILECSNTPSPPEPSKWLYHPGRSVNRIVDEILELAEMAT